MSAAASNRPNATRNSPLELMTTESGSPSIGMTIPSPETRPRSSSRIASNSTPGQRGGDNTARYKANPPGSLKAPPIRQREYCSAEREAQPTQRHNQDANQPPNHTTIATEEHHAPLKVWICRQPTHAHSRPQAKRNDSLNDLQPHGSPRRQQSEPSADSNNPPAPARHDKEPSMSRQPKSTI